jgi:hypothetical protein
MTFTETLTQDKIIWQDFSRGFHGGKHESQAIKFYEEENEKQFIQFIVQEYTSDREDFFGVCVPAWEIFIYIIYSHDEYETENKYRIGEDYARAEYAQEFCEYVLHSVEKHGNISRLPYSEFIDD